MALRFGTLAFAAIWAVPALGAPDAEAHFCAARGALKVTYIANEGFLLAAGGKKVLIDSLHRGGIPDYAVPDSATLEAMETARGLFAGVNLVLVSHRHADHFDPASVARHLSNNSAAWLISSPQVVQGVSTKLSQISSATRRMQALHPESTARIGIEKAGIRLELLSLRHEHTPHAGVQNLGHLLTVAGVKILHIGDAEMSAENFAPHRLPEDQIDIAFLPYWYLITERGRDIITRHIRPKCVVAMHMEPAQLGEISKEIAAEFPSAVIFSHLMETRAF